ncbi:hypothetical protein THAOC_32863, partial [Thalassiosira oceanica]
MQARDSKRAKPLPDPTLLEALDNDLLIRCASYFDADGLARLGRTSAAFGTPQAGQQRSLANEAAHQRFRQSATDEERRCLPKHDDESDIGLYRALEKLREPLSFDELAGHGLSLQEHPARVMHTSNGAYSTAMSGHVMRGGRHFVELTITYNDDQLRRFPPYVQMGVIRPISIDLHDPDFRRSERGGAPDGALKPHKNKHQHMKPTTHATEENEEDQNSRQRRKSYTLPTVTYAISSSRGALAGAQRRLVDLKADWRWNVVPVFISSHYRVSEKLRSQRTAKWGDSDIHCCSYDCNDGLCRRTDWDANVTGDEWHGREGLDESGTIGLLLDLDEGTLSVFKNNRRLGVMKGGGLGGEYCWFVSACSSCALGISKRPAGVGTTMASSTADRPTEWADVNWGGTRGSGYHIDDATRVGGPHTVERHQHQLRGTTAIQTADGVGRKGEAGVEFHQLVHLPHSVGAKREVDAGETLRPPDYLPMRTTGRRSLSRATASFETHCAAGGSLGLHHPAIYTESLATIAQEASVAVTALSAAQQATAVYIKIPKPDEAASGGRSHINPPKPGVSLVRLHLQISRNPIPRAVGCEDLVSLQPNSPSNPSSEIYGHQLGQLEGPYRYSNETAPQSPLNSSPRASRDSRDDATHKLTARSVGNREQEREMADRRARVLLLLPSPLSRGAFGLATSGRGGARLEGRRSAAWAFAGTNKEGTTVALSDPPRRGPSSSRAASTAGPETTGASSLGHAPPRGREGRRQDSRRRPPEPLVLSSPPNSARPGWPGRPPESQFALRAGDPGARAGSLRGSARLFPGRGRDGSRPLSPSPPRPSADIRPPPSQRSSAAYHCPSEAERDSIRSPGGTL